MNHLVFGINTAFNAAVPKYSFDYLPKYTSCYKRICFELGFF